MDLVFSHYKFPGRIFVRIMNNRAVAPQAFLIMITNLWYTSHYVCLKQLEIMDIATNNVKQDEQVRAKNLFLFHFCEPVTIKIVANISN